MEICGFSWFLKLLAARNSKIRVVPTFGIRDNGKIDFGINFDGQVKRKRYDYGINVQDVFRNLLNAADSSQKILCYGIFQHGRRIISTETVQDILKHRSLLHPTQFIQPAVKHEKDQFYTLQVQYYSRQYNTKIKPKCKNIRIYHKIKDIAKVVMWEIESRQMKRVMKITMEFTTDKEGRMLLSYCYGIHLAKAEVCLKFKLENENDIKQWFIKEQAAPTYFPRDPSVRSLKNNALKVNKVFLKDGQLRNVESYDNIPIVYKSLNNSKAEEQSKDSSLEDYNCFMIAEMEHSPPIVRHVVEDSGTQAHGEQKRNTLKVPSSANSLLQVGTQALVNSRRASMVDSNNEIATYVENTHHVRNPSSEIFNDAFKEMLYKSVQKEQMDLLIEKRLKSSHSDNRAGVKSRRTLRKMKTLFDIGPKPDNTITNLLKQKADESDNAPRMKLNTLLQIQEDNTPSPRRIQTPREMNKNLLPRNLLPTPTMDQQDTSSDAESEAVLRPECKTAQPGFRLKQVGTSSLHKLISISEIRRKQFISKYGVSLMNSPKTPGAHSKSSSQLPRIPTSPYGVCKTPSGTRLLKRKKIIRKLKKPKKIAKNIC